MCLIYTSSTFNIASSQPQSPLQGGVKAAGKMLKGWRENLSGQAISGRRFRLPEPSIREVISADGQIAWEVYEPISQLTKICRNRSEVQAWLGQ